MVRSFLCTLAIIVGAVLIVIPVIAGIWRFSLEETVPVMHMFRMICTGAALAFLGWFFRE